ncbi:MAG: O-methyltransferase [Vulcanibacillus sp.]
MRKDEYIRSLITLDNNYLDIVGKQNETRKDIQPSLGVEVGKLLGFLRRVMGAKRILEFGTCIGYSTIWLAEAVKLIGGKVISIKYDEKLYEECKENIAKAGLSQYVEIIYGDASKVIDDLEGEFDLIIQDSDKSLYPIMLKKCIQLTRINGIIVSDDSLFKPMGIPEKFSKPVDLYNQLVFNDKRLYSTILPIGDGVTISIKIDN